MRPAPLDNAICHCLDPEDAKWIAGRLNLAVRLEEEKEEYELEWKANHAQRYGE